MNRKFKQIFKFVKMHTCFQTKMYALQSERKCFSQSKSFHENSKDYVQNFSKDNFSSTKLVLKHPF